MGVSSREQGTTSTISVLYVDPTVDGPDETVESLVTDDRFEVEYRRHTAAALDALDAESFDCVVSECSLEQTDVFTFLEEVRDRSPEIPFFIYTDRGSERVASDAFAAGVTDYITKSRVKDADSLLSERISDAVEGSNIRDRRTDSGDPRARDEDSHHQSAVLFEGLPVPAIHVEFVEGDTVVRDLNPAFEETFGFDTAALAGQSAGALTIPTGTETDEQRSPPTEPTDTVVTRLTTDGPRQFRFRTVPLRRGDETTEAYGIYTDTVDHGGAGPESSLTCHRVDRALEATTTGMWAWNVDADRFDWHESTARLFGCQAAELGDSLSDFLGRVHPVDRDDLEAAFQSVTEEGGLDVEFRVQKPDGSQCWVRGRGTRLSGGDGPAYLVGIFTEITAYKEREAELTRFESIIEASGDPVYVLDEDGKFEFVNDAFVELTGYARETVIGRHASEFLDENDVETAVEIIRALLQSDIERGVYECELETNYGTTRWVEINISLLRDDGSFEGTTGFVRDITERKEYERRLEQQRDDLDVLNQIMQHDIRNNLQTVVGFAEALEERLDGENREYAATIRENAANAVDFTQTARELGDAMLQTDAEREPVSLTDVLEPQLEAIRSRYDDAVVTADDIPETTVLADERLESVFRNLLENAIEHNDKKLAAVHVSVTEADDRVIVRFADNGPGVPDELKDAIFEKGGKGLESEGSGIGLYLVNTLVEQYGGDISVEDNDPEGTVFTIELPTAE